MILSELLKDQGDKFFYSPLFGPLLYMGVDGGKMKFSQGVGTVYMSLDGYNNDGSLALFPSKIQKDWEGWAKENHLEFRGIEFDKALHPVKSESVSTYYYEPIPEFDLDLEDDNFPPDFPSDLSGWEETFMQ